MVKPRGHSRDKVISALLITLHTSHHDATPVKCEHEVHSYRNYVQTVIRRRHRSGPQIAWRQRSSRLGLGGLRRLVEHVREAALAAGLAVLVHSHEDAGTAGRGGALATETRDRTVGADLVVLEHSHLDLLALHDVSKRTTPTVRQQAVGEAEWPWTRGNHDLLAIATAIRRSQVDVGDRRRRSARTRHHLRHDHDQSATRHSDHAAIMDNSPCA